MEEFFRFFPFLLSWVLYIRPWDWDLFSGVGFSLGDPLSIFYFFS